MRSRGSVVELTPRWHTGNDYIYMPIGCHSTARLSSRENSVAPRAEGGELPSSCAELRSVRPSRRNLFRPGNRSFVQYHNTDQEPLQVVVGLACTCHHNPDVLENSKRRAHDETAMPETRSHLGQLNSCRMETSNWSMRSSCSDIKKQIASAGASI